MGDVYNEQIVKRKIDSVRIVKTALIIVAALAFSYIALVLFATELLMHFISFLPIVLFGAFFGAYWLIRSLSVEYEYALTNGELDIDKIIAKRKRKRLLTCSCKEFESFAPVGGESWSRHSSNNQIKIVDVSSGKEAENRYFALFTKDGQKQILVFEPNEKMLESLNRLIPRRVFEK